MKERELRNHLKCDGCGNPIAHTGLMIFWRVRVERFGVDVNAAKRQDGLAAFMGSAALASVMGPDEDMTIELMEPKTITFCDECAVKLPVAIALDIEIKKGNCND